MIARAGRILRALEGEKAGLSLGQIAQRVNLARSTVQRIVEALSLEQLVTAASPSGGVRLGPALIRLAQSAGVELDQITHPLMVELSQRVGETVDLSVLKGNAAVFTDQVQGAHRLRAVSGAGETFPLYCTANGKALLSVAAPEAVRRVLGGAMPKLTPHTLTQPAALLEELEQCRRSGVAFDNEEHTEGICAVGSAFVDPSGRALALSIPVPTSRFKKNRAELVRQLLAVRQKVLDTLG